VNVTEFVSKTVKSIEFVAMQMYSFKLQIHKNSLLARALTRTPLWPYDAPPDLRRVGHPSPYPPPRRLGLDLGACGVSVQEKFLSTTNKEGFYKKACLFVVDLLILVCSVRCNRSMDELVIFITFYYLLILGYMHRLNTE